uniref:DUF4371 domain-containing protein n=1 Tax=Lactuca sativa TaxID=4236 RepID=A0A9R1UJG2_LACSA|nr:hypothetical protein LSAT_V11C900493480 [Lactuca sativa]
MMNQESRMSLHKFYKKKEDSEQQHKYTNAGLNSLPVDPIKEDVAFSCYLFKSSIPNQGGSYHFVKFGFKAWNRKSGIVKHKEGIPHTIAVQKCQSLMNQRQSITFAFEKQTTLQEKEYRSRLNASIDCVRFLLRQGSRCVKECPKNAQMKCGESHKDIVQACSDSRDVSCKEQMTLVLRYVNRKGEVVEMFVGLRNVSDISTLSLKATIYDMLSKWNLSPSRIRGQGYDGDSNMSGAFNGL